MNSIYDYLDYREFLKDRFDHLKQTNPNFSYRYFNKKAGLKSPGHLKMVMDGQINIGQKGMYGVCRGLGLSEKEGRFFENLVNFNQAKEFNDKDQYYKELLGSYPAKHPEIMGSNHYKIFAHWYYICILELIRLHSFREDACWISKKLKPQIPVVKVKRAIKDLLDMGLIKRTKDGELERTDKMIATPSQIHNLAIMKFQQQLTKLAWKAIERDPSKDRENSTITIALSDDQFSKVKDKIQEFRDEIHSLLEATEEGIKTNVAHINLQLFKLTSGGKL